MISARTFFSRLNQNRKEDWLENNQLIRGCEVFFSSNGYDNIEYNKLFDKGQRQYYSEITGSKPGEDDPETIAVAIKSKVNHYERDFFSQLESTLYDLMDNYTNTSLMLVTDSLSYDSIVKLDELGTSIENFMQDGMYLLFINNRLAYAMFDSYEKLTRPIPISY